MFTGRQIGRAAGVGLEFPEAASVRGTEAGQSAPSLRNRGGSVHTDRLTVLNSTGLLGLGSEAFFATALTLY